VVVEEGEEEKEERILSFLSLKLWDGNWQQQRQNI